MDSGWRWNYEWVKNPSSGRERRDWQTDTDWLFEVNLGLTPHKQKKTEKPPHRCSQAAVGGTSQCFDWDARPPRTLWQRTSLQKSTVHSEEDASFCTAWNILTNQVSLVAPGSTLKEGRARFVFQHGPENCWWMHFLSLCIHTHTRELEKKEKKKEKTRHDCMLMRLLVATHYLLGGPKD